MESGKHYNQRFVGKKRIHFTESKVNLDEAELSGLIDALDYASKRYLEEGAADALQVRASRVQNTIEDFHTLKRKLIAERKELRDSSADSRAIEFFRVQIKAINKGLELFKLETSRRISESNNAPSNTDAVSAFLFRRLEGMESKFREASLEVRRKNSRKREAE